MCTYKMKRVVQNTEYICNCIPKAKGNASLARQGELACVKSVLELRYLATSVMSLI